jgi:hypothetical protein
VRVGTPRRIARLLLALTVLGAGLCPAPAAARAGSTLPDVDVVVIAEVQDTAGWLNLHQEVLATPVGSLKRLRATLPARTGGGRSIDIDQPRFSVGLATVGGQPAVKVTVAGKVASALALTAVTPFQQAALEIQGGAVRNEITLDYGLSIVVGRLLELYFDRP